MSQRNNRRGRGGRSFRGGFSDQTDGASGPSAQRSRMGFESVMRRNFPNRGGPNGRRQFLQRIGVPVRGGGGGGGGRGRGPKFMGRMRNMDPGVSGTWSKVQIVRGKSYGKEFLTRQLSSYVDGKFQPVLFKFTDQGDVTFFIDNPDVAAAIKAASRRIVAPTGHKVIINVSASSPPYIALEQSDVEILKTVLDQRYDSATNHMNLSDFSHTPGIEVHGSHLSLNRNNVMMAVVNLLGEACPSLKSIDLSNNRMRFLDYFGCLNFRCPNILSVSLANNLIDTIDELERMSFWELTDLNLDENPLCAKFRDKPSYISAVRKYFPTLTRLDGTDLRPTFKTGIEDVIGSAKLPELKESFLFNDNYKQICGPFVAQYFSIFDDSDRQKRQNLLDAYDSDAVFTLSAVNLTSEGHSANRGPMWSELIRSSHNIKKMEVWSNHRSKMVQNGRLSIVSFFCSHFPETRHDPTSFIMDISFATESLICLNVNGLFKEANGSETGPCRYFTRVFLLVPRNNGGVAIINDEMFISTLSAHEETGYRRQLNEIKMTSSNIVQSSVVADASIQQPMQTSGAASVQNESNNHAILVNQFAQLTKMKPEWAEKCLDDQQWNFEQAAHIFNVLMASNSIPQDAFQ